MPAERSLGASAPGAKADGAFRTIGQLSTELGVPQHILRYWETRFPQLRPLQRAGNRRYYRPEDVALARRIDRLLNHEGYTVKGVQKLLAGGEAPVETPAVPSAPPVQPLPPVADDANMLLELKRIRERLARALDADDLADAADRIEPGAFVIGGGGLDHPDAAGTLEGVADHIAIARLEDVQRKLRARKEKGSRKRKEGNVHRPQALR